jgi:hypothetical protein
MIRKLLMLTSVLGLGLASTAYASNDSQTGGDCAKTFPTDLHCPNR